MGRVTDPLSLFGARAYGRQGGRLPMTIVGAANPVPVRYALPVASAQVKSAVLLAGLNAPGETVVIEREPTRDHSERMLVGFGAKLSVEKTAEGHVITLTGQPELRPQAVAVPRDPSSAAFPVCAALIVEGSDILVPGVSQNLTRNGLYLTLVEMGAEIEFQNPREEGGEPVADLRVRFSGNMKGIEVPPERAPVDDRRIPDPVGGGLFRDGQDGDAGGQGAAGQGKRPDRRDGPGAGGLRGAGRGG